MSERLETAMAALAQMTVTAEAFQRRYEALIEARSAAPGGASSDALTRESLLDAEVERTRIAHELHDTAAQGMVAAHRFLEAAEVALAQDRPDQAAVHVESARAGLMAAIRDLRRVINTLVPPGLEELGVANALERYVRDRVPTGIDASVTGTLPRAEGWLEARLFAMAAVAIDEAVEPGRAGSIRIALSALRGRAMITIGDDGVGFDPGVALGGAEEGMGLSDMARQAGRWGGRVDVERVPGEGSTVRISVPLPGPDPR